MPWEHLNEMSEIGTVFLMKFLKKGKKKLVAYAYV